MKKFCFFFSLLFFQTIYSQSDSLLSIDELVDNFIEKTNENVESSQIYTLFEYLLDNPINLNTATVNDLMKIPFLDFPDAEKLVQTVRAKNKISSLDFLDKLDWLNRETARNIKPFLTVKESLQKSVPKQRERIFAAEFRTRLQTDLQTRKGFKENKFTGSKLKNYNRLKLNYSGKYRFTLLTEKDAGEKSFTDFYSANFSYRGTNFLRKLVLGDYLIEFGQGLALWSPYAFSKGSEAVRSVIKRSRGILEYTSSDENRFFRGIASALNFDFFRLSLFYSENSPDASLSKDSAFVTSLNLSGYHRTEPELLKKDILKEKSYGAILHIVPFENLSLAYLFYNLKYSLPFLQRSKYGLTGNSFSFHSVSVDFYWNIISFNMETAYNSVSLATIANLKLNLTRKLRLIVSFRNYPRNYYNLNANGFGESNRTQNETGFYTGISWKNKYGVLNLYYDLFRFPFSTHSNLFPASGNDFMLDFQTKRIKSTSFKFRYKREEKSEDYSTYSANTVTNSFRLEFTTGKRTFSSRSRYEIKFYRKEQTETGYLLFQELNWNCCEKLLITGRAIFFNTDSYAARLYEFEKNVRGVFYNPALFGKGIRWYFLVKYKIFSFFELSLKYSETYKPFDETIGSGYSELPSNLDNNLILQLEMSY